MQILQRGYYDNNLRGIPDITLTQFIKSLSPFPNEKDFRGLDAFTRKSTLRLLTNPRTVHKGFEKAGNDSYAIVTDPSIYKDFEDFMSKRVVDNFITACTLAAQDALEFRDFEDAIDAGEIERVVDDLERLDNAQFALFLQASSRFNSDLKELKPEIVERPYRNTRIFYLIRKALGLDKKSLKARARARKYSRSLVSQIENPSW